MKKTFLTFLAVGFGVSVAFAQTAEPAAAEQQETMEQAQPEPADDMAQAEPGRTKTELANTPPAVQEAIQNGEYSDMEVVAVYEVTAASPTEPTEYEIELAPKTEGAEATEAEGLETEKVSNRQPAITLIIDENGEVKEEKNADEME